MGRRQNVNFAIKINSIQKFLAATKINLPVSANTNSIENFDEAQKCLALVRAGNVTEEELKQSALVCVYRYVSLFDLWYRFQMIEIEFYDFKNGDSIFKVGQYQDDPFSSEDAELNRLFAKISSSFFPSNPNPFIKK